MKKTELKKIIKECLVEENLKNDKYNSNKKQQYSIDYSLEWSKARVDAAEHSRKLVEDFKTFVSDTKFNINITNFFTRLDDNKGATDDRSTTSINIAADIDFLDEDGSEIPLDNIDKGLITEFIVELRKIWPEGNATRFLYLSPWQDKLKLHYKLEMASWKY